MKEIEMVVTATEYRKLKAIDSLLAAAKNAAYGGMSACTFGDCSKCAKCILRAAINKTEEVR